MSQPVHPTFSSVAAPIQAQIVPDQPVVIQQAVTVPVTDPAIPPAAVTQTPVLVVQPLTRVPDPVVIDPATGQIKP